MYTYIYIYIYVYIYIYIYIYTYIYIYIWRCDDPGTHRILTVISAYYGYYGIFLIHLYGFNIRHKVQSSTFSNW